MRVSVCADEWVGVCCKYVSACPPARALRSRRPRFSCQSHGHHHCNRCPAWCFWMHRCEAGPLLWNLQYLPQEEAARVAAPHTQTWLCGFCALPGWAMQPATRSQVPRDCGTCFGEGCSLPGPRCSWNCEQDRSDRGGCRSAEEPGAQGQREAASAALATETTEGMQQWERSGRSQRESLTGESSLSAQPLSRVLVLRLDPSLSSPMPSG